MTHTVGSHETKAVLLDLGGTLVEYYTRDEFPAILHRAIGEVCDYLRQEGVLDTTPKAVWPRVEEENHESEDYRVRPLEGRLIRIFQVEAGPASPLVTEMCQPFMAPIFALARVYPDALPVLRELRSRGVRTAIVSNTPWGCSSRLWAEEIQRLGLGALVNAAVFCRDVSWRKPAPHIFRYAMSRLDVAPQDCLFVGDDPRWDLAGARALGIEAVLIARRGMASDVPENALRGLRELLDRL